MSKVPHMLLMLLGGVGTPLAALAQSNDVETPPAISSELLLFAEIPVVVSSGRQEQPISKSAAAVSIITAEDIHASGLTTLGELLQFAPGMDVLPLNRHRYAYGVRGLHDTFSDRVLTLIDGRMADNPVFGGSELPRLPVFLEDIERIEIVRGPASASWGANAYNGVINIITKKPQDVQGKFVSATVNNFGDAYTQLRWADQKDDWAWHMSTGYERRVSTADALDDDYDKIAAVPAFNPLIGFNAIEADDALHNKRFTAAVTRHTAEGGEIAVGGGYSYLREQDQEFLGLVPTSADTMETLRLYAKYNHLFDDGAKGYVQWFGNFHNDTRIAFNNYTSSENDLEAQYNFNPHPDHKIAIGGNIRFMDIDTEASLPTDIAYAGEPFHEKLAGLFVMDRWQMTNRFALETQLRGDYYSETTSDWSGRLSGIYSLDEEERHIMRLSAARAFRTPLASIRSPNTTRVSLPGGGYVYNLLLPAEELGNEGIESLELGYTGILSDGLTLRLNSFYQRFSDMIGYEVNPVGSSVFFVPSAIDSARAYGGEAELSYSRQWGKISGWYAYNFFKPDVNQSVRAFYPARHKIGGTLRMYLDENWTGNVNYKYAAETQSGTDRGASAFHRFDLTIARKMETLDGEFMIGVADLFNKDNDPVLGIGAQTAYETPGRNIFARLQFSF